MRDVPVKKVDMARAETYSEIMLPGCIPGCTPYHHSVMPGESITLEPGKFHRNLMLFDGEIEYETAGQKYEFHERAMFIPHPDEAVTLKGITHAHVLEMVWELRDEDVQLMEEYKTEYPFSQLYRTAWQYTDRNKSKKTINRQMVRQRVMPRFCIGSVETYGVDAVRSHDHPMLDQYFFSFAENHMNVLIDFEPIRMEGCELLYIPLGAMHGIDVPENDVCHYMWIDFYPDNDEALKRLDWSHKGTGEMRSFDNEKK